MQCFPMVKLACSSPDTKSEWLPRKHRAKTITVRVCLTELILPHCTITAAWARNVGQGATQKNRAFILGHRIKLYPSKMYQNVLTFYLSRQNYSTQSQSLLEMVRPPFFARGPSLKNTQLDTPLHSMRAMGYPAVCIWIYLCIQHGLPELQISALCHNEDVQKQEL